MRNKKAPAARKTKARLDVNPAAIPPASGADVGVDVELPVVLEPVAPVRVSRCWQRMSIWSLTCAAAGPCGGQV